MVWLHGGGFANGSGGAAMYDGAALARRGDVVTVTVNHRLNVFGYLNLAELGGHPSSGEAGMLDIVRCWSGCATTSPRFGGDPGNVTIFGESGGGMKVSLLLAMPAAQGLFHRAIVQSGPGLKAVSPGGRHRATPAPCSTSSASSPASSSKLADPAGRRDPGRRRGGRRPAT